jgi:hypothetical protein
LLFSFTITFFFDPLEHWLVSQEVGFVGALIGCATDQENCVDFWVVAPAFHEVDLKVGLSLLKLCCAFHLAVVDVDFAS